MFQSRSTIGRPRDYLSRREQWRLLLLVGSLGLIVFLMNEARKPENWAAWFGAEEEAAEPRAAPPARTAVDNVLPPPAADEGIPGAFHSPAEPPEPRGEPSAERLRGVQPEFLEAVRDDIHFRPEEQKAWFNLLDVLNTSDAEQLRKQSIGRVPYVQLFRQSATYRGQLVTVRGNVHWAHRVGAPKNDVGIEAYYQLWLQPDDNPMSPMLIYCLELPEGFPTGTGLLEEAEITGFFFKRRSYVAQDGLRTAPTLLAKTVDWTPAPELPAATPFDLRHLPWIIAAALLLSGVAVAYVYRLTRPQRRAENVESPEPGWTAGRGVEGGRE